MDQSMLDKIEELKIGISDSLFAAICGYEMLMSYGSLERTEFCKELACLKKMAAQLDPDEYGYFLDDD